jgi:hypothetical protein
MMPANLHPLAGLGHPLLVSCKLRLHRAAVAPEVIGPHRRSRKDFRAFVVPKAEHVERFLAKAPLDDFKAWRPEWIDLHVTHTRPIVVRSLV